MKKLGTYIIYLTCIGKSRARELFSRTYWNSTPEFAKNYPMVKTFILIVSAVVFTACPGPGTNLNSTSSPVPGPTSNSNSNSGPNSIQIGSFDRCCTLTGSGESMACVAPMTNCYDDVVVKPAAKQALRLLDESVDKGTTATFFAGEEWKKIFPGFEKHPKDLDMLRKGLPLLRFESDTKGLIRYVATRQSREAILNQTHGKTPKPISGVEFALTVRQEE
jgi:hypothetical protein